VEGAVALGDPGQGASEAGVEVDGTREHPPRESVGRLKVLREQLQPAQVVLVGFEVAGRRPRQRLLFGAQQVDPERRRDLGRDVVLDGEDVGQGAVVALGSDLRRPRHRPAGP
jgi:hypothetical protein